MLEARHALLAYVRARTLARTLRTRADIERHQRRLAHRLVRDACRHVPFYRAIVVRDPIAARDLSDLPVIDKALQQARFAEFNRPGIAVAEIVAALAAGHDRLKGFCIGQSTGTSGNRGRFVISEAERFTWLGTIVAKALPDAFVRRHRVALVLPGFGSLYGSASQASRITLRFFDLTRGVDTWRREFETFAPDTVVAPPKALRRLAESGALRDCELFSAAEVLDPLDRAAIERANGRRLREIYMATEGLFGVSCRHGTLHLAEDVVRFEWETVADSRLVAPVVTDLVRRVQPMIRYRMNDLLELDPAPCACGSVLQPVRRIEGRRDDAFELAGRAGAIRMVTPDVLRNAVVDADARIDDFRIIQTAPDKILVRLPAGLDDAAAAVRRSLDQTLAGLAIAPVAITIETGIDTPFDRKLRRVIKA
jgi:putative adenylate-forming enzyme